MIYICRDSPSALFSYAPSHLPRLVLLVLLLLLVVVIPARRDAEHPNHRRDRAREESPRHHRRQHRGRHRHPQIRRAPVRDPMLVT